MKIRMQVAYDGTDFCGWQRQNHGGKPSLCQTIQEALESIFQQKIDLFASGRTDAGVHAMAQQCHFVVDKDENFFKKLDLAWALKSKLPPTITVRRVWEAPVEFHSTLSAEKKTYKYLIYQNNRQNPFLSRNTHWVRNQLNRDYLNECAQYVLGEHDFKSFQSVGTEVAHTVRTIMEARWERKKREGIAVFCNWQWLFEADGQKPCWDHADA